MLRRTTQTTRVSANPVKVFPPNHFNLHLYSCHHCVSIFLTGCQASPSAVRLFFFFPLTFSFPASTVFLSPIGCVSMCLCVHVVRINVCVCVSVLQRTL